MWRLNSIENFYDGCNLVQFFLFLVERTLWLDDAHVFTDTVPLGRVIRHLFNRSLQVQAGVQVEFVMLRTKLLGHFPRVADFIEAPARETNRKTREMF